MGESNWFKDENSVSWGQKASVERFRDSLGNLSLSPSLPPPISFSESSPAVCWSGFYLPVKWSPCWYHCVCVLAFPLLLYVHLSKFPLLLAQPVVSTNPWLVEFIFAVPALYPCSGTKENLKLRCVIFLQFENTFSYLSQSNMKRQLLVIFHLESINTVIAVCSCIWPAQKYFCNYFRWWKITHFSFNAFGRCMFLSVFCKTIQTLYSLILLNYKCILSFWEMMLEKTLLCIYI